MCTSTEELDKLLQAFKTAAEDGDTPEMERVLAIEAVKKHFLEIDNNAILRSMAQKGYTAAVDCIIKSQLVSDTQLRLYGNDLYGNKFDAITEAVKAGHIEIVKLLVQVGKHCTGNLPNRLTVQNHDAVEFMLTLPDVKYGIASIAFTERLEGAIRFGSLGIVELLLKEGCADEYLSFVVQGHCKDPLELAISHNHLGIAYCFADKMKYIEQFHSKKYYMNGQHIVFNEFLKQCEHAMALKVSTFNADVQKLTSRLSNLHPLKTLILEYFGKLKGIPSKFTLTINQSPPPAVILSTPVVPTSPKSLEERNITNVQTVLRLLIACRIPKDSYTLPYPELALRRASALGRIDIVKSLINHIKDLDINQPGPASGKTAIMLAEANNRSEVVNYLRETLGKPSADLTSKSGKTETLKHLK